MSLLELLTRSFHALILMLFVFAGLVVTTTRLIRREPLRTLTFSLFSGALVSVLAMLLKVVGALIAVWLRKEGLS